MNNAKTLYEKMLAYDDALAKIADSNPGCLVFGGPGNQVRIYDLRKVKRRRFMVRPMRRARRKG